MTPTNITALATPSLLLDIEQLEKNIQEIVEVAEHYGVDYRPHVKTHKSAAIAHRQMAAGATGMTVAKVGEAEKMVEAGITDILIAFPVMGVRALKRINAFRDKAKITLMVDSEEQVNQVSQAFSKQRPLAVWIKVNSGLNRCGVEPKEETLWLAQHIQTLPSLKLEGIFTHAGHSYAAGSVEEIKQIAAQETRVIRESAALCEAEGIPIENRSVGSTPTFKFYGDMDGITEIRPGNAVFFDMVQVSLGVASKEQCALTVLSSVASMKKGRIVIDAGSKTLALDKGAHGNDSIQGHGHIKEHSGLVIDKLSEEHGIVSTEREADMALGEKLVIIPNHACPVVNLFDYYTVHQAGKVLDYWPVTARGKNN